MLNGPAWRDITVLDFGGSRGNFLRDPACCLPTKQYWCVDVTEAALAEGRRDFPEAHWIHYNRYNRRYNPSGAPNRPLPHIPVMFDVIVAYSVFTHVTLDEMINTATKELFPLLSETGVCVITFLPPGKIEYFLQTYSNLNEDHVSKALGIARQFESGFYLFGADTILPLHSDVPYCTLSTNLVSFYEPSFIGSLWRECDVTIRLAQADQQTALVLRRRTASQSLASVDL